MKTFVWVEHQSMEGMAVPQLWSEPNLIIDSGKPLKALVKHILLSADHDLPFSTLIRLYPPPAGYRLYTSTSIGDIDGPGLKRNEPPLPEEPAYVEVIPDDRLEITPPLEVP